jgi:hypothetical protein
MWCVCEGVSLIGLCVCLVLFLWFALLISLFCFLHVCFALLCFACLFVFVFVCIVCFFGLLFVCCLFIVCFALFCCTYCYFILIVQDISTGARINPGYL